MPNFGKRSRKNLATAHPELQRLMNDVINQVDFAVLCGHRGRAEQEKVFAEGRSKLQWPKSKHNATPARAVDIAPWPIDFEDLESFRALLDVVKATAKRLGIKIVCGIDWKRFPDAPHVELG